MKFMLTHETPKTCQSHSEVSLNAEVKIQIGPELLVIVNQSPRVGLSLNKPCANEGAEVTLPTHR